MQTLFFTRPPCLGELCSITLTTPPPGSDSGAASFQPQIIKCRQLIFTEPDIIATPCLDEENKVLVIMQQSLYRTGRLQTRFLKLGCQAEKPRRVTHTEYQQCLNYTLLAKLAPTWNKTGDYLVQGRDFITCGLKMQAVIFELHVTENELYISVIPKVISSRSAKLRDLGICTPVVHEFFSRKPHGRIEEYSIENKWCHVLPSMKKGQVVNVLHQIPTDSPFRTYKDIKKHWKNTYGYRLPEDDTGVLYYQVYFKPVGDILFTYPEYCVRSGPVLTFPRSDPQPILHTFLHDLHTKVPSVCGQNLQFDFNPAVPRPELLKVPQMTETGLGPNLSSLPAPRYGYRPYNQPGPQDPPAAPAQVKVPERRPQEPAQQVTGSAPANAVGPTGSVPRTVPTFKPIVEGRYRASQSSPSQRPPARMVPVFTLKKPTAIKPRCPSKNGPLNDGRPKQRAPQDAVTGPRLQESIIPGALTGRGAASAFTDCTKTLTFAVKANTLLPRLPAVLNQVPSIATAAPTFPDHPQTSARGWQSSPQSCGARERASVANFGRRTPVLTGRETPRYGSQSCSPFNLLDSPLKRKVQAPSDVPTKKIRSKPKVNDDIDVEVLARKSQLGKANAATLAAWLKAHGVPCKAKDKKGDLVERVYLELLPRQPEQ